MLVGLLRPSLHPGQHVGVGGGHVVGFTDVLFQIVELPLRAPGANGLPPRVADSRLPAEFPVEELVRPLRPPRRLFAEWLGTAFLLAIVVGSGMAQTRFGGVACECELCYD